MILSSQTIHHYLNNGEIMIHPYHSSYIQPASVDLTIGRHFMTLDDHRTGKLSMKENASYREIHIGERESIIIPPHSFMLATTKEWVKLPSYITAFVEGRSSIGRMGLFVQNAGWVDPGFEGRITLELFNANRSPIELIEGWRICQLIFAEMDHPTKAYSGKYLGQSSTTPSAVYKDMESHLYK